VSRAASREPRPTRVRVQRNAPSLSAIPITEFQVSKELGHGGTTMVKRVYGHLGEVQHRSEVVEYRIEYHREALGDRLMALEKPTVDPFFAPPFGTVPGTVGSCGALQSKSRHP